MDTQTLMTISTAASVIGNVTVLTSLIFVFRQLKNSERQTKEGRTANAIQIWHNIQTRATDFYVALATSNLAAFYQKGRTQPDSLTPEDRARFFYLACAWFTIHEHIHAMSTSNYLPSSYFEGWVLAFTEDLRDPGFRWFWSQEGHLFDHAFQRRVNSTLKELDANAKPA